MLSKRIEEIKPSPTLSITAKAKEMKAKCIDVIDFGAGEPDFDTPKKIKSAAKDAIDRGFTKYTPTSGMKELKEAICKKLREENLLFYSPEEIIVSCGAKHSIFNAVLTLCDEGDEVILSSPYWVSYLEMIKISEAIPVIIKTKEENNFKVRAKELEKLITPKTKLFILNSPTNPTGAVYNEDELKDLSEVITKAKIFCLSDEVYEKIIYDGIKHISISSFGEDIKRQTIVVNGVSKTYSMTGWRIGYAAGPKDIIQAMSNLQDHSTSNPTSISQVAALEALEGGQEELKNMIGEFRERRDYMVERINSIKGIRTISPKGAFYCWIDISQILGKSLCGEEINSSLKFAELLLKSSYVCVVPGCLFGDDNFIRLSFATSKEKIAQGLNRMEDFINRLSG